MTSKLKKFPKLFFDSLTHIQVILKFVTFIIEQRYHHRGCVIVVFYSRLRKVSFKLIMKIFFATKYPTVFRKICSKICRIKLIFSKILSSLIHMLWLVDNLRTCVCKHTNFFHSLILILFKASLEY